ncbi:MAG: FkbM family methyltransferase [Aestuariivirga sp.]
MPIVRQLRRDQRNKESEYLKHFARKVTSQTGEDGVLEKIFELIGAANKWCVEFGAWDGKTHSNSYNLIANHGWSSVQIEGNSGRFADLRKTHGENKNVHCLNAMIGYDPRKDSIEYFLRGTPIPSDFDLLSIDIDGNDYHIWASIGFFRPRVIIIEFNPVIPNDMVYVQDRDFSINQGSSLRAMVELGKRKGYELASVIGANAIFVVKEEFPKLNIADNHIDSMFYAHRDAKLFLLYDGTLVNFGLGQLRLRQADSKPRDVDPFEFQVYAKEQRFYGGRVPETMRPPGEAAVQAAHGAEAAAPVTETPKAEAKPAPQPKAPAPKAKASTGGRKVKAGPAGAARSR